MTIFKNPYSQKAPLVARGDRYIYFSYSIIISVLIPLFREKQRDSSVATLLRNDGALRKDRDSSVATLLRNDDALRKDRDSSVATLLRNDGALRKDRDSSVATLLRNDGAVVGIKRGGGASAFPVASTFRRRLCSLLAACGCHSERSEESRTNPCRRRLCSLLAACGCHSERSEESRTSPVFAHHLITTSFSTPFVPRQRGRTHPRYPIYDYPISDYTISDIRQSNH